MKKSITKTKSSTRAPTSLCGIGDDMSELNIQRRLQWLRECNHVIKFNQVDVNADPALQKAVLELPHVQIRKPPK